MGENSGIKRVFLFLDAMASTAPPRRPKRKRVRKSRTAVISSSESSSSDEGTPAKPAETLQDTSPKAATLSLPVDKGGYDSDSDSDVERDPVELEKNEEDLADVQDALSPPIVHVPTGDDEEDMETLSRTRVDGPLASRAPETVSDELRAKQHASFRALWMQALTDEFGNELDHMRQTDPRLGGESAGGSHATARLPLLIDALSFGSEVFSGAPSGAADNHDTVDEISMALPAQS